MKKNIFLLIGIWCFALDGMVKIPQKVCSAPILRPQPINHDPLKRRSHSEAFILSPYEIEVTIIELASSCKNSSLQENVFLSDFIPAIDSIVQCYNRNAERIKTSNALPHEKKEMLSNFKKEAIELIIAEAEKISPISLLNSRPFIFNDPCIKLVNFVHNHCK